MGVLISLFVTAISLMVGLFMSLFMTMINLLASLLGRSMRAFGPRRGSRKSSGALGGFVLLTVVVLVALAAAPRATLNKSIGHSPCGPGSGGLWRSRRGHFFIRCLHFSSFQILLQ